MSVTYIKSKKAETMLKPEFFNKLKQTNVSQNAEKTMERLRAVWKPLVKGKRDEILALADIKQSTVERAYKTGNVSAKVIAAMAQVLSIDPLYLVGGNDEERAYDDALVIQFLKDLKYDVGKDDAIKKRKPRIIKEKTQPEPVNKTFDVPPVEASPEESGCECVQAAPCTNLTEGELNLATLSQHLSILFDADSKGKLDDLTEDDLVTLLMSLHVQAGFSKDKRDRLTIIKCLLLM
jgi:hypothetical protein